jgi:hypothetical protein
MNSFEFIDDGSLGAGSIWSEYDSIAAADLPEEVVAPKAPSYWMPEGTAGGGWGTFGMTWLRLDITVGSKENIRGLRP